MTSTNQAPPQKRKRSLPGNPDPDAEVIGLSPKTLMAANRFVCEICNKGFQRDQNLQLHRRGHNLPWKLKQRSSKEVVRKKVYVCPEAGCVHHNPARALGDLTGIKKHFSRKHGEKKWKCDKCSKRYAVQSDWKAHSKICGTREYRCDCGTLFSRRDSFITHRAFCDALAEESGKSIWVKTTTAAVAEDNYKNIPVVAWDEGGRDEGAVLFSGLPSAHMSATALLQKAAQMGVTMSTTTTSSSVLTGAGVVGGGHNRSYTINQAAAGCSTSAGVGCDHLVPPTCCTSQPAPNSSSLLLHDIIMSSFSSTNHDHQGFTRDFLGLKAQTTAAAASAAAGFGNISCLTDLLNSDSPSTYVHDQNPNHTPCQGYRPSHHP